MKIGEAISTFLTTQESNIMKLFKDVDTEQFWLTVWSLAAVSVLMLVTIITIHSYFKNIMLSELIKQGHDPMELACLYEAGDTMKTPCLLMGQAKAQLLIEKNHVAE